MSRAQEAAPEPSVDEILARELANSMTAGRLREWCSENGVSRPRGAGKLETARLAVEQERDAVVLELV